VLKEKMEGLFDIELLMKFRLLYGNVFFEVVEDA
jgi:hypothetical protein